ncbi:hypothetical protein IAU60_004914 [Kwoniella sp. DSM 27419]
MSAQVEAGQAPGVHAPSLTSHRSSLPDALYLLSFAGPCPAPWRRPRAFIVHPYVLYTFGAIAALVAGVGLPAFDIVFGYWTNGINGNDPESIAARGRQAGWIMTMVGLVVWLCFAVFNISCESTLPRSADG